MKYIYIAAYDKTGSELAIRFEHQFIDASSVDEAYSIGELNTKPKSNKLFLNDYVICIDELKLNNNLENTELGLQWNNPHY